MAKRYITSSIDSFYGLRVGDVRSRWTVLALLSDGRARAHCRCECGKEASPEARHVANGKSKSCGCMPRFDNRNVEIGKKYGRLTVLSMYTSEKGKRQAICQCECGRLSRPSTYCLAAGVTKSCRCLSNEVVRERCITHGDTVDYGYTTEYARWKTMIQRCTNPNSHQYADYGGRGIAVCVRWLNSFENFIADMGRAPFNTSIDRRNNDLGYSPDNCRWATAKEQGRNKRNTVRLTLGEQTLTLCEWAEITGIPYDTLKARRNRYGWNDVDTLTTHLKAQKYVSRVSKSNPP